MIGTLRCQVKGGPPSSHSSCFQVPDSNKAAHLHTPSASEHIGHFQNVSPLSPPGLSSTSLLVTCLASVTAQNTGHTHSIHAGHPRLLDRLSQAAAHHSCCCVHLSYKLQGPQKSLHKAAGPTLMQASQTMQVSCAAGQRPQHSLLLCT